MPPKGKQRPAQRKPAPGKRLIVRYQQDMPRRLVARPQYRRIFKDTGPQWLVLEPHRLGLIAGSLFTVIVLVVYSVIGVWRGPLPFGQQLIGAMATFVVGYAGVGIYVWYLLYVTEQEFGPEVEPEKKARSLVDIAGNEVKQNSPGTEPAPAAPEPQLEEETE